MKENKPFRDSAAKAEKKYLDKLRSEGWVKFGAWVPPLVKEQLLTYKRHLMEEYRTKQEAK